MAKLLMMFCMLAVAHYVPATGRCITSSTCTIKSKLRNSLNKYSSQSLLSVKTSGGLPTGMAFTGRSNDKINTEFEITSCTQKSASGMYEIHATVRWRHDQTYALAVKSNNLVIEKATTAQIGDKHRFRVSSSSSSSCGHDASCATYKSIATGKYIATSLSGAVKMTSIQGDRGTGLLIHCN